jgi:hypothetical protein
MKLTIIIAMAIAVIVYPFRSRITRKAILRVIRNPIFFTRLAYVGIAMIWLYIAQDAARIHISPFMYAAVSSGILLLYAAFPLFRIWLLVIVILLAGWGLNMYQTLEFQIVHLGLKTDMHDLCIITSINVFILILSASALYLVGPFNMKRPFKKKEA